MYGSRLLELTVLTIAESKDEARKAAALTELESRDGITKLIKACLELGKDPAETIAIFRIPGAWEDEGNKILDYYGVEYCDRSVSLWDAAGRAVAKIQEGAGA